MSLPRVAASLLTSSYRMTVAAAASYVTRSPTLPSPEPTPVAVLMSRFPSVTETFILREMIEMERQGMPVRVVSMIKETPPVLHEAIKAWIPRALFTPFFSWPVIAANWRMFARQPLRYLRLVARLIGGTIHRPNVLI